MTGLEITKLIGRSAFYRPDKSDIAFAVEVMDTREVFGRKEARIKPRTGRGARWVSLDNLTLGT